MTTTTTKRMSEQKAIDLALTLARGRYQRDLITGRARLSGADLKGLAKKWGARYAASRSAVLRRVVEAGVPFVSARWPKDHGLRTIEWGSNAVARVLRAGGVPEV
jgi:hypothetical protein